MQRSNLDERQRQKQLEAGNRGFWVMVSACILLEIYGLFFEKNGDFDIGELSMIFWAGMLVYFAGNIKEGIWDSKLPEGVKESLLFSICFSGIMTIVYWGILIIQKRPGTDMPVNKMAGVGFCVLFIISFLIYYGVGALTKRRRRKNEKKYIDD